MEGKTMNIFEQVRIAKISKQIDSHLTKRCSYCNKDYGNDRLVSEFLTHLIDKHPTILTEDEKERYKRLLLRI